MVASSANPFPVRIMLNDQCVGLGPGDFCLSRAGLEFVINYPLRLYQVIELELVTPAHNGHDPGCSLCRSGVVVDCTRHPDNGDYKISLLFLEPEGRS